MHKYLPSKNHLHGLFFAFFLAWAAGVQAQAPAAAPAAKPAVAADARATATAQIMAGIQPAAGDPVIDKLLSTDSWTQHKAAMQAQWKPVRARLDAIEKWRDKEVKVNNPAGRTLLYPFSGPDFLNAWALYPNHAKYIFLALENPGILPNLDKMGAKEFDAMLRDVRNAFAEIFQRNYFITSYMGKQLTTPHIKGTVPIMATMMALYGLKVAKIESVDPFPELTKAYEEPKAKRPGKILRGAKITFIDANNVAHELSYFSLDATDKALVFYPDFLDWVGRNRPASALVKSASYLLHDNQFSKTRDMVLASADILVQDDTGVPLRYISAGQLERQAVWQISHADQADGVGLPARSAEGIQGTGSCRARRAAVPVRLPLEGRRVRADYGHAALVAAFPWLLYRNAVAFKPATAFFFLSSNAASAPRH